MEATCDCGNRLPRLAILAHDPHCSTECAKRHYGVPVLSDLFLVVEDDRAATNSLVREPETTGDADREWGIEQVVASGVFAAGQIWVKKRDAGTVTRLVKIFGGSAYDPTGKEKRYQWRVGGPRARALSKELYPRMPSRKKKLMKKAKLVR